MTNAWPVYGILASILVLSFGTALFLPTTDILHWVVTTPGLLALVGVGWQIFRDHAQYEKNLRLQHDQQHFVLGVTSHMADVAFDRHVAFCEKYIAQMQETLSTLFNEGPTEKCLALSSKLADIRLSFRTWLISDIQNKILPFEHALTEIAGMHIELKGLLPGDIRTQLVESMYNIFTDVLNLPRPEGRGEIDETVVAGRIMDHLQDILGVKQLVHLRIKLVDKAVKNF